MDHLLKAFAEPKLQWHFPVARLGLMVQSLFLYRLCKFLVGDESEGNSDKVQQRLYMDSASALALIRPTGTGRLKHIQIKQFFLRNLLRTGVFHFQSSHEAESW